jgi:hypothetical protein
MSTPINIAPLISQMRSLATAARSAHEDFANAVQIHRREFRKPSADTSALSFSVYR